MADAVVVVGIVASFGGLAYTLLVLGPSVETSTYRHALWRYRDELYDLMRQERRVNSDAHPALVYEFTVVESLITYAEEIDLFWFLAVWMHRNDPVVAPQKPDVKGLDAETAARLKEIEAATSALTVRHAALGSTVSAMTTLLLAPIVVLWALRARSEGSDALETRFGTTQMPDDRDRPVSALV